MNRLRTWAQAYGLQSLLLVLVIAVHYMPDHIGSLYHGRELAAAKAWQLVFRGAEAMLLYLIVWSLVPHKPVIPRYAASLACAWGAFESIQIPACRLQFAMDRPPSEDSRIYAGLCDHVTGLPIYMSTIYVVLIALALNYTKKRER
jgi:hypothetical protein